MERTFGKRKCVWCGKEFIAKSPRQNACKDEHYRPCAVCGEPLLIRESYGNYMKNGPRTCSKCKSSKISATWSGLSERRKAEIRAKTIKTNLQRYGAESPMQNDEIKTKVKKTVKERYGVDNLSQSDEIQLRMRENNQIKYGADHPSQNKEVKARMMQGMVDKYGAATPIEVPELRNKIVQTNLEKYGVENVLSNKGIQQKIKSTCLNKYGVEFAAQAPEVIERRMNTNMQKYGAPGYVFSDEFIAKIMSDPSKLTNYQEFRKDPSKYILTHFEDKPTYRQLSLELGICDTSVSYWVNKYDLHDIVSISISNMEAEVTEFLKSLNADIVIEHNNRQVIHPKEIDIYLPDYNLGIECNPTASHNSDIPMFEDVAPIPYSYHKHKTDLAKSSNVELLHLFGYDWVNHKDVMKSIIRNKLGLITNKIYARNTICKEVSWVEGQSFLLTNHRQGRTSYKLALGLYYNGELVSMMTFGKLRATQGKILDEDTWELSRFCSKLNTSVIGGASKLFNHFIQAVNPDKVVSFSDRATTSGNLYKVLQFNSVSQSDPGYVWAHPNTEKYYNRVSCQKRNLLKLFNDVDIHNHTESEIMIGHGYGRVYDSGLIRWEWVK